MPKYDSEGFIIGPEEGEERDIDHDIKVYMHSVNNFSVSPDESLDMLDLRDILYENTHLMTDRQRRILSFCDLSLLSNAYKMTQHLSKVYDFEYSKDIPSQFWWWHLNNQNLVTRIKKAKIHGKRLNRNRRKKVKVKEISFINK